MEAWRARIVEARQEFIEDDEEDQANFNTALGHLEDIIFESPPPKRRAGGSRVGKARNIHRDHLEMHNQMFKDYFSNTLVWGPIHFRRRFHMRQSLFLTIMDRVCTYDSYFVQKRDACGVLGLSSHQKITCALRMLALGVCADALDEYCRVSESTAMESMKRFCAAIRAEFGGYHLRQPTYADLEEQLAINAERGFPGIFASLDCMHYKWKNCPTEWQGDFGDRNGQKSIILEAIADQSLHIWHAFFGLPGSKNDINVLDRSPLIQNMLTGAARDMKFVVNGQEYNQYYILADGIYPWSCFVQTIPFPSDEKRAYFAKRQEACCKDVISNPCKQWSMDTIADIMFACCILHNMILDDERDVPGLEEIIPRQRDDGVQMSRQRDDGVQMCRGFSFEDLVTSTIEIENEDTHYSLRGDLIEHLWAMKGNNVCA